MSRSKWKLPVVYLNTQTKPILKIWKRSSQILFRNLKDTILVHDGKEFRKIRQEREKIGFKFGCFSFTRKHSRKLQNIKKNAKK
jgi:ribosomal protein S19